MQELSARLHGELFPSPEGRWAVIRTSPNQLQLWDIEAGKTLRALAPTAERIPAVAVTGDGRVLAPRVVRRHAGLVDLGSGELLRGLDETRMTEGAAFSNGGLRLAGSAIGYGDTPLGVWETATAQLVFSNSSHTSVLALSGCGRYLATQLLIWDLDQGRVQPIELQWPGSHATAIALSGQATSIVAGSRSGRIAVWRGWNPQPVRDFGGHTAAIASITITSDAALILSGSRDCTLRLWRNGEEVDRFLADAPILTCAITPNGDRFVASDAEGTIYFLGR